MGIEAAADWKDSVITSYRDHCTHLCRGGTVLEVMAGVHTDSHNDYHQAPNHHLQLQYVTVLITDVQAGSHMARSSIDDEYCKLEYQWSGLA